MLAGVALGLCSSVPASFSSQLWRMSSRSVNPAVPLQPPDVHSSLGCWQRRRFDLHSLPANAPTGLLCYRTGKEDLRQRAHAGAAGLLVAADGIEDLRANCQGTGFVVTVGADHRIIMELSAPVWRPVASQRREAVGLLSIPQKVEERYNAHVHCPAHDLY